MAKNDKKAQFQEKESFTAEIYKKFKQRPGIYIGSVVVLVLVTVTFIGGDMISGGFGMQSNDLTFGYYDNIPISWVQGNMFTQYHERAVENYQYQAMRQGRELDMNDPNLMRQIWRDAYHGAVVHTAILQMLKKSNYQTPEKAVDRAVAQLPQFMNNGRFSPALYNNTPETKRLTIWRQTQEELGKIMFFNDFFSLLGSSGEADFVAKMETPMRSFKMVSFLVDDYPESEYRAYGEENARLFDQIHLSKITVTASEREAKKILSSIKDGTTTFEEAAKMQSQDGYADRGGDMGSRYMYQINTDIPNAADRDVITSLGTGELSDVVKIGDSWVIFRIENELMPANFDNSAVMERVRMHIRTFSKGRMEDWAVAKAREFINDMQAVNFESAALRRSLEIREFGPLPINYGGVELFTALHKLSIPGFSQQSLHEMGRNENFWKLAFSTPLNMPSEPFVFSSSESFFQGSSVLVLLPVEEVETGAEKIEETAQFYSSDWVKFVAEQSLQYYFLGNEKMEDLFDSTYGRIFR